MKQKRPEMSQVFISNHPAKKTPLVTFIILRFPLTFQALQCCDLKQSHIPYIPLLHKGYT